MGEQVKDLVGWARRRKILAMVFVALTLAAGIMIGTVVSGRVSAMKALNFAGTNATPLVVPDPVPSSNSFSSIVNRVEPAVVNIATTQVLDRKSALRGKKHAQPNDEQGDDPMQDFFDRFFQGQGGQDAPPQAERSLGSGVIVDKRGYILTNNHVVDQATKIQVQLNGETQKFTAKVVGIDEDTDLAVIKIDAGKDLPTAKLGNSEGVQVGDWVIAIGSPFGLQATVTAGIISAQRTSRDLPGASSFQNFLQTDAPINPGNSGGPLLNVRGEVIGVNTAIFTRSGGYMGIGLAIPSKMVQPVIDQILSLGSVKRAYLGVALQPLDKDLSDAIDLNKQEGILISDIVKESPASEAGLRQGDIITECNGKAIKNVNKFRNDIGMMAPGTTIKLKI